MNAHSCSQVSLRRRLLLASPLAMLASSFPLFAATNQAPRVALVIGNRHYPHPEDLPPAHKNARDVGEALEGLGFEVETRLDLGGAQFKQEMRRFAERVAAAGPGCVSMLFYTGHGAQLQAENLLIPVNLNPYSSSVATESVHLFNDVVNRLPGGDNGLNMVVIDACRTSLRQATSARDGLNQVEAPKGALIAFSTGAGRPAISPAVETMNSFYAASFVKVLRSLSPESTFSDVFRLVRMDVQQIMRNHPIAAIRKVAQDPFIAENIRGSFRVRRDAQLAPAQIAQTEELALWAKIDTETQPAEIVRLSRQFLSSFPSGAYVQSAKVALAGAEEAVRALAIRGVKLFPSAFKIATESSQIRSDLPKAARGDKDAAMRIGMAYSSGGSGLARDAGRHVGWLQYAVELGNGIASYELAKHFRAVGQVFFASQYEARALDLGFTPPVSLDNVRK